MNSSLVELYQIEYQQHAKVLESGYLTLATEGANPELLNQIMRAAHSLKGAARLVDKNSIADAAHELESLIKSLSVGEVDSGVLRSIYHQLERLGLRADALRGDHRGVEMQGAAHGLLHITPSQVSNLIHLASDLAVLAQRLHTGAEKSESGSHSQETSSNDVERIRTLAQMLQGSTYDLRLVRLREVTKGLTQIVQSTADGTGKSVRLHLVNGGALVDRQLIAVLEPCLIQIMKNAVDHGIETPQLRIARGKGEQGRIVVSGRQLGANLQITISDDGSGVDLERIRAKVVERGHHSQSEAAALSSAELIEFLFLPGFSTKDDVSEYSGRGVGLDIVRSRLQEIGGTLSLESVAGESTTFTLTIPSQIASFRSLVFAVQDALLAVPLAYVEWVASADGAVVSELEGVPHLITNDCEIPLVDAETFFPRTTSKRSTKPQAFIVVRVAGKRRAFMVSKLVGEEETVLKRFDSRFERQSKMLGTAIGSDNSIITILNVESILGDPVARGRTTTRADSLPEKRSADPRILVVDDSLTVRELERRILVSAGFVCDVAVDGVDGLQKLQENSYDLIVTDLDMPRMNGIEFITEIRGGRAPGKEALPIVVVSYKERPQERSQVHSAGANEFLSKGSFKDQSFLSTIRALLELRTQQEAV